MQSVSKIFGVLMVLMSTIHVWAQTTSVTISGVVTDKKDKAAIPYVNVVLKTEKDSVFVTGVVTNEEGRFTITDINSNSYYLEVYYIGYLKTRQSVFVGTLSQFLQLPVVELEPESKSLSEVVVTSKQEDVSNKMDKKSYSVENNLSQNGGSVLQA